MLITMPEQVLAVLERYKHAGLEGFIVGGCVRDSLMGKNPQDWDICTNALPEQTKELFKDVRVIETGIQHGTVTVIWDDMPLEITTYRIDGEYKDHRRPEQVQFTSDLQADLSRRDFTINALAYNPWVGLVDCFQGQEDLKSGIIRCVGEPKLRFEEDGLRILRGIRFACVLNFQYDRATEEAIKAQSYLLDKIAKERIQVELNKILLSNYPGKGVKDLYRLSVLMYIIPELCHGKGFEQNNPFHHCDVFDHMIEALGHTEANLILRLTMLLHDVGKPYTWSIGAEGTDYFIQHGMYGEALTKKILNRLKYDRKTVNQVSRLVACHDWYIDESTVNIKERLREIGVEGFVQLLAIKRADIQAQHPAYLKRLEKFERIESLFQQVVEENQCYSLAQLAVNGKDLEQIGVPKGKEVGNYLQQLLDQVIQEKLDNDSAVLLQWVREQCLIRNA